MRADCEMSWVTAWQGVWLRDKPCQGPADIKQLVEAKQFSQSDQSVVFSSSHKSVCDSFVTGIVNDLSSTHLESIKIT